MKDQIFSLLKNSQDAAVSGEQISQRLGVSRVAVWKHLQQMRSAGLEIDSTAKGYRLISIPDIIAPWMFTGRADRIHVFSEVSSTMDKAMALARSGCAQLTIVVAEHQTRARGRLQRQWVCQKGGLYFTMVIYPALSPPQCGRIHLAAAIDLAATLRERYAIEACLKWPNDILVNDRKLVGILSQMDAEMDLVRFVTIGIGVNVNNVPGEETPGAVSITQLKDGRPVSRAALLAAFLDRFEQRLMRDPLFDISVEWKRMALTIGRRVKIQTARHTVEGKAVDLDPDGGLIVETQGGGSHTIVFGDCFHQN